MPDWTAALSVAFARHLDRRHRADGGGRAAMGTANRLPVGTTGTTLGSRKVPRSGGTETAEPLGFGGDGTTGTGGTTRIGHHLQSQGGFDFEERAALVEDGAKVPRTWAEAFARLDILAQRKTWPDHVLRETLDDAGRFLDRWGVKAASLGWSAIDVFGAPAEDREAGAALSGGLVPLIHGGEVEAIAADRATIRMRDGGSVVYLRRPRLGRSADWDKSEAYQLQRRIEIGGSSGSIGSGPRKVGDAQRLERCRCSEPTLCD